MKPIFALALAMGLVGAASPALACSCAQISREKAIAQTPYVFEGRVLSSRVEGGKSFAEFEVLRPIKGGVPRRVEIMSRSSPAACGVVFRQGEIVTVGAFFAEHQFSTNSCTQFSLRKR